MALLVTENSVKRYTSFRCFLPESSRHETYSRLKKKLSDIKRRIFFVKNDED